MRIVITILFLSLMNWSGAQTSTVPAIIKRLYQIPGAVNVQSYKVNNVVDLNDLPKNFKYTGQEVTKNKNGVFLHPLGTGRLYQLKQIKDSLVWTRLDSTVYTGYNFGALFFSLDTTLYSFAGQGFFNHNGNLRYFNEVSKEWDAVNLSQTVLWLSQNGLFYSIDTTHKHLFIEPLPLQQDQALKNRFVPDMEKNLWKLDLKTGEWEKLGRITKERSFVMAETPFGTLVNFTHIVDLSKNKIFLLNKSLSNKIINALGTSSKPVELAYSFCIDSTLYMGDINNNYMDSVVISRNDLTETNETFYTPVEPELPIQEREVLFGFVIILGLSSATFYYKLRKTKTPASEARPTPYIHQETPETKEEKEPQIIFKSGKLLDLLNEREKVLLEFIYRHSLDERLTTIEEINKVIGAAQRNSEVQKRLRSDLIGSINDKLEMITESKFNVIDKQRSEFDKRSFEYFIRPEHMSLVEKVLGKKA